MEDKQYEIVIVLCPSALSKKQSFDELSPDGSYLGGAVRMQAAVDLFQANKTKQLIVVGGGYDKKNPDVFLPKKVNDMKHFLEQNNVPCTKIIRIMSKPDTHGNLRAIHKCIGLERLRKFSSIGLLTNFYHLPRALRFAADTFQGRIVFHPISAESTLAPSSSPPNYLRFSNEFLVRIFEEIKGLRDWEYQQYRDQHEEIDAWWGVCHPDDESILSNL